MVSRLVKRSLLALSLVLSYCIGWTQPQTLELRTLTGYHANDKLKLSKGINYLVFSNEREFERYFGKSYAEDKPNFDFEHVLVMITRPTDEQYFLSFAATASKAGNYIEVYCNVRKEKHLLTYIDHPIALVAIPKYFAVTSINLYSNKKKKLLKKVKVSAR